MKAFFIIVLLIFASLFMQAQTTYLPFTESFEYGTKKWTDGTTGGTSEVTTAQSVVGVQSYHLTGTATSSKLTNTFSNSIAANSIMYYVQAAGANGGNTEIGNGTNFLFYGGINGGNFVVSDVNGSYAVCQVTAGEWVKVELKKINYTNHTYDLWVNDTLRKIGLEFNTGISSVSKIALYNTSTGDEAWWDAIFVGMTEYSYPDYSGNIACMNGSANVVFTTEVLTDTLVTTMSVGPVTADTFITYFHPAIQSAINDNNGLSSSWSGNMFDIIPKKNISIYSCQVNANGTSGTGNMKLYYREGTYVGNNTSSAGWLLHDSVSFINNPTNGLCDVTLSKPLPLRKGVSYGLYFCYDNGVDYTDGNGTNQTLENEDMTCTFGVGGSYFSVTNNPRVWSGRLLYQVIEEQVDTATLTTMFASNNTFNGNMIDLTAKNDIIIDSLDVNIISSGWVKVYYRNGTCVSHNLSSTGWALLDSVEVIAAGQDNPTRVPLNNRLLIPAGELYSMYVCSQGSMRYTNDNGINDTYIDSNIVLVGEYGGNNTFNCPSDRVWNGRVYYTVRNNEQFTPGAEVATYTSTAVRGYNFEAPTDLIIKGLRVPDDNAGNQWIEIVRFNFPKPSSTVSSVNDFVSLGRWENVEGTAIIPCSIFINKGDHIGVYGYRQDGANTPVNSYATTTSPLTVNLLNQDVELHRSGASSFNSGPINNIFVSATQQIGRVEMYVEDVIKSGGEDSVLVKISTPAVNLGSDTTICAGQTITLDAGSFITYNWSTGGAFQTENIDSTGTGIGSTDVWVTVTDIYGCTGSDTISITFEDCTGIEENDMLLSVYPNPSNGMFTISAEGMNTEMFIEVISPEGRVVRQIYSTESITAIDLTGENAGVYYVKIQIEDQVKVLNIVLQ